MRTTWKIWTYDVWGNANDGYEVNDCYCQCREHEIESDDGQPTDAQVRECFETYFGLGKTRIDIDGDDRSVYVTRERDGYPIGEMIRNTDD